MLNLNTKKRAWDFERFGFFPQKLKLRLKPTESHSVLCNTLPKSGTHLIERALCLHPALYRKLLPTVHETNLQKWGTLERLFESLKAGQLMFSHLLHTPEREQALINSTIKSLFLVRDPRDIALSNAFYLMRNEKHPYHSPFAKVKSEKEAIELSILGAQEVGLPPIEVVFNGFLGWTKSNALKVRFEDLVGHAGGGDPRTQERTLKKIYQHLELETSDQQVKDLASKTFSDVSPTFRKGSIGGWSNHFDDRTKELFKEKTGDLLLHYGYEESSDW